MENRAQKLADRFAASSVLRMAEANAREAPTQPLFHYTTEQALDAIVKSEVFWFTSIYHMDDDEDARDLFRRKAGHEFGEGLAALVPAFGHRSF